MTAFQLAVFVLLPVVTAGLLLTLIRLWRDAL